MAVNEVTLDVFSAGDAGSKMTHFIGVELMGLTDFTRSCSYRQVCADMYIPKQMTVSVTDAEWNRVQKAKELMGSDAGTVGFYFLGERS